MSKEAMKQALEAQEHMKLSRDYARLPGYPLSDADRQMEKSTATLREALAKQPAEQKQVTHAIIAGALFDFMGWLTSRKERLSLSSSDDASPVVVAITEFAKMRKLSLEDAKVIDWNATLQPPAQRKQLSSAEMNQIEARWDACMHGSKVAFVVRETEAAHGIKENT